jgi:hypothetical protein
MSKHLCSVIFLVEDTILFAGWQLQNGTFSKNRLDEQDCSRNEQHSIICQAKTMKSLHVDWIALYDKPWHKNCLVLITRFHNTSK